VPGLPHPNTIAVYAAERRADFHAEAERDRLAQQAEQRAERRPGWPGLVAVAMFVVVVALLLAAGSAAGAAQAVGATGV
jgi:hypothetical protein